MATINGKISIGFNSNTGEHYKSPAVIYTYMEFAAIHGRRNLFSVADIEVDFLPGTGGDTIVESPVIMSEDDLQREVMFYYMDIEAHEKGEYTDRFMGHLV
ncbi:hypothetical protein [Thiothrix sp.]|jgi:hypothetical protein|uniref:hypothetical protein n=1 Tax=Thiothrix sp. TaxID=1032 RepID=UPI002580E35C|nr:hypothetical protein [Thiothrix sp.]